MEQLVQGILDLVNCFVWMITLGYNKQLYQALRDFVSLTAVFFASYKNTLSKIFAVILVVGRTQFHPLETANDTRPDWIQYDALDGPEWQKVKRCATLAMGMYYWPTYLFLSPRQPLTFLWTLLKIYPLRFLQYKRNAVFGDGFFYKKTAAFLAGSNTSIRNLHYASWDNNVNQTPFSIVTDEETHSIVVSIRGSSSINDFLTDVDFTDSHLSHIVKSLILDGENVNSIALGGKDQSRAGVASPNGEVRMKDDQQGQPLPVHGGMFSAAMVMLGFVLRVVVNIKQKKDYADYKVVVTGHSLGAGVASLLTLMLKNSYSDVRCYAFSPPGCIVGKEGIPLTKQCVYSFFVGNDCVPRLSYKSMERLRDEVREASNRRSMTRSMTPLAMFQDCSDQTRIQVLDRIMAGYYKFTTSNAENKETPRLYAPGHILYLTEDEHGEIERKFVDYRSLQHLVCDGLTPFADHMALRVKRIVHGEKHIIFSIPVLSNFRLVREFFEFWY